MLRPSFAVPRRAWFVAAPVALLLAGGIVSAADSQRIDQRDKQFSKSAVTVRRGESLVFANSDTVKHSVMTSSGPEKFNLGILDPGQERGHAFPTAGAYEVRCGIHPRMKLAVTVR